MRRMRSRILRFSFRAMLQYDLRLFVRERSAEIAACTTRYCEAIEHTFELSQRRYGLVLRGIGSTNQSDQTDDFYLGEIWTARDVFLERFDLDQQLCNVIAHRHDRLLFLSSRSTCPSRSEWPDCHASGVPRSNRGVRRA